MLAVLEADRLRIAQFQSQILDLERTLSDLRLEQSKVQERLDAYIYPVLTLPNEVTSEIFRHILPPYHHFPPFTGPLSPTLLTHICRRWRDIALATPELWSVIASGDNHAGALRGARMVRLWLERSRSCPLYLELGVYKWADDDLVEAVIPHRARWNYLSIDLDADNLRILDGPMPLLRYLLLNVHKDLDGIALNEVPLLRTVALTNPAALRFRLPWAQLTSLGLFNVHSSDCVPILLQTRNLVRCELHFCQKTRDTEPQQDISLPCLESLVFTDPGEQSVTDFLPALIVPALRNLEIPELYLAPNPVDSLKAFISKSACKLNKLRLMDAISVPANAYREAFPSLPKLFVWDGISDTGNEADSESECSNSLN
ncbi:hypothetical protein DFH06DRAFT_709476 [Mycena polygramma]|nr:hypothetical protein DFH06DRAFT_709476 [Mycena polygramma]